MALVTRDSSASLDASTGMFAGQLTGDLFAGEALDLLAPCYIKISDGKVYMSNGTAANEAAGFAGFTPEAYLLGEAVTLFSAPACFRYAASGLVIGKLFIAATAGRLDTVASVGDAVGVARAINATDIQITRFI